MLFGLLNMRYFQERLHTDRLRKLLAVASFAYQSLSMLSLYFIISHLLPPSEYAKFSLLAATGQFCAIGLFEWIRMAISRHYPGSSATSEKIHRHAVYVEIGITIAVAMMLTAISGIFGVFTADVALVVAIGMSQGMTDILLAALRLNSNLSGFAKTQVIRSTFVLLFSVGVAYVFRSAALVSIGLFIAYCTTIVCCIFSYPATRFVGETVGHKSVYFDHMRYGMPAALASVMNLGAVLVLRYGVSILSNRQDLPGILFAFDVMQRPFNVIITALHSILYPSVVSSYDSGNAKVHYWNLVKIELIACIFLLVAISVIIPDIAMLFLSKSIIIGFSLSWPFMILLFATRSVLINILYIKFHLRKMVGFLLLLSTIDLFLYALYVLCLVRYNIDNTYVLLGGALALSAVQLIFAFFAGYRLSLGSGLIARTGR